MRVQKITLQSHDIRRTRLRPLPHLDHQTKRLKILRLQQIYQNFLSFILLRMAQKVMNIEKIWPQTLLFEIPYLNPLIHLFFI